ncbi:DUF1330 domain-containing protein [Mesorhizobium sp. CN5-321]|jgi:uncharacterized protein (DUF1330 family)|uniref:DUF1330 domain-containing protein n=1 Tax=Mesorhizobium hunchu TaxID=3157708 RepID=UPI0032B79CE9
MKKGYWIAMVSITDPEHYKDYIAANAAAFGKFGARFLARGGEAEFPEGFPATRTVIIEFESYETALACYRSPEYAAALRIRRLAATAHVAIVEGV